MAIINPRPRSDSADEPAKKLSSILPSSSKRKRKADITSANHRIRASTCCSPQSPPTATSRPQYLTQKPHPQSIYGILRQNAGLRLHVTPLHWTNDQLRHIKCRFEEMPTPQSDGLKEGQREGVRTATKVLLRTFNTEVKCQALQQLLCSCDLQRMPTSLKFRLGRGIAVTLQTDGLFSQPTCASPSVAYIDLGTLPSRRDESIKMPPGNRVNPPVARLRQKQLRRLVPRDNRNDPFIAAIVIALAQERRGALEQRSSGSITDMAVSRPPVTPIPPTEVMAYEEDSRDPMLCFPVYVLATSKSELILYEAQVTAIYLDKFALPSRYISDQPLVISYRCLPLTSPSWSSWLVGELSVTGRP